MTMNEKKKHLQSMGPHQESIIKGDKLVGLLNESQNQADQLRARVMTEYFSMIEELLLVADQKLTLLSNNFSPQIWKNVVKLIKNRFKVKTLQLSDNLDSLESLFVKGYTEPLYCSEDTVINLFNLYSIFEYETLKTIKKSFFKERKLERVLSVIEKLQRSTLFKKIPYEQEPIIGYIKEYKKISGSVRGVDFKSKNKIVGVLNQQLELSIPDILTLIKEYFMMLSEKSMRYAFSKTMYFNFYLKENVQMKIRMVPVDDRYYIFVMFENIEDKANLLEINSKLNYSMMLIQSLSHEMFTPLHHLLGISKRLHKKLSDEASSNTHIVKGIKPTGLEMRDEVLIIHQIGMGLSIFVQNILDFANIINNTFELHKRRFFVLNLMEYLMSIFSVKARQKNLKLRYECDKSTEMFTDYNRLAGLLYNLIDNSVKFTQKGGITIHAHSSMNHMVFKVVDTGIGIDEGDIKKISDIFKDPFLADKTKSSAGLGIGLRISLALIKSLSKGDLTIDISSEKNQGTTIQFEISQGFDTPLQNSTNTKNGDVVRLMATPISSSRTPIHSVRLDKREDDELIRSHKALEFQKERVKLRSKSDLKIFPENLSQSSIHQIDMFGSGIEEEEDLSPADQIDLGGQPEINMFKVTDAAVAKHLQKRNKRTLVSLSVKHVGNNMGQDPEIGLSDELPEEFEFDEEEERNESKIPCKLHLLRWHHHRGSER